ncbi:membrane protein insertion efficiency factor YidD [Candidatus Falkowbacteria bacterium CG10_big_fil_rev_8_21_14_0_10_38_22]|uniref:Putative membrane protein insertion efficiency factor n=2 Tax=Candidatus Falkowiibacteriota TaxID=1752728 RepID=A0A2M6WQP8_9BACT|nr:membrane protein insertion efficiency factor YidD [Candidatus Falkowbacteria bacterium]PIT95119.1 MAG: membrane protein insertion efficiency factor YidD [Candidatus Falkowbacteria bacterium CG10_big_fil_rev_8_21_14_0_10_38_22]
MLVLFSRYLVIKLLKIYQRTLSFDHGVGKYFFPQGFCRFQPSCSDYAIAAIEKYGVIKGGGKALWRVLRCNPFNRGGWDPLK